MKMAMNLGVALIALPLAAPALAQEPQAMELAKKNQCLTCHSLDQKMVGPAWRDVAKKYAGDPEAEAKLIVKVKKGGSGVWGTVPMPPNVTVKDADIKTMVQYVLSLK